MSRNAAPAHRTHDLVVGVDGTPASANAVRYARKAAALSGGRVAVYHVIPDYVPMAGMYPIPPHDLVDAGRSALHASLRQVEDTADGVVLETHLRRGSVVRTLTSVGHDAHAIVVGSDRRRASLRVLTGNVSTGVAARSAVPVVSVPETWRADRTSGLVVVGVKSPQHSEALMAEAFDLAQRTASRLRVLHIWQFPDTYDELVVTDAPLLAEWAARNDRELEALVAPWRHSYPGVDVELRTVRAYAAQALVAASEEADELVIVRRSYGIPAAAHLGATARAVLLHAHCPVRVVPAVHVPVLPDLEVEAGGAALKQATA
jgi:nucleotide-binding universal stress UspA family protein